MEPTDTRHVLLQYQTVNDCPSCALSQTGGLRNTRVTNLESSELRDLKRPRMESSGWKRMIIHTLSLQHLRRVTYPAQSHITKKDTVEGRKGQASPPNI